MGSTMDGARCMRLPEGDSLIKLVLDAARRDPDGPAIEGIGVRSLTFGAFLEPGLEGLEFASGEETAFILQTSGTTARPKTVCLSHINLCASARNVSAALALSPRDRCLNVMPLFHGHGLVGSLMGSLV